MNRPHAKITASQSAMTIALWRPTDGLAKFKMFALIDDGEVVKGEFHPPRDADLSDEEPLLHRFNGPGAVASQFESLEDEALKRAETAPELEGVDELGGTTKQGFRCTMCGSAPENPQTNGDERRWMPCPECEKDRFFEPIDGDRR
jgi:hypothetical protein